MAKTKKQQSPDAAQIEQISTASLIPYARNARTHSETQVKQIAGSIQEFGFCNPVLIDATNGIIAGHGRVMAAQLLKLDTVPCLRLLHLTDAQKRAYVLADNRIALSSGWDEEMLANELSDLHADEFDMALLGFDVDELAGLLKLNEDESVAMPAGEVVEDEVPEVPAEPITKPGNLWILGNHRLLCGDSTKSEDVGRLMCGQSINLAFTSPPYASQRKYDESSGFKPIPPDGFVKWFEPIAANVKQRLAADGSWFVNIKEAADEGQKLDYVKRLVLQHKDVWGWMWIEEYCWPRPALPLDPKTSRRFKNGWESVFHFSIQKNFVFNPDDVRHESDGCFTYKDQKAAGKQICDGGQGLGGGAMSPVNQFTGLAYPSNMLPNFGGAKVVGHSAAFPVGLPSFFIKAFSDENANVYEPFCGSGSTLIAAEQLNRKCYGMEISPAYCDVIVKRWENLTGKKAVLEAVQ